jgi:probable F420-dependent oxidoreductase
MSLKEKIPLGMVLPHRSPEAVDIRAVRQVAQNAEALGFRDLWVTENSLDHVFCFDPMVVLTYAAAVTTTIRLGVAVVVLPVHSPIHVAHQVASLDYVSQGRAILGVGLGRDQHYAEFQVPRERRVRRFREGVELIKALWTEPRVSYRGEIFQLDGGTMAPKPVQKPHPPIWLGGGHPDALRRAAVIADGWMGSGGSRWPGRRCTAGTARCITTPKAPTPRASTARRSRCGSGWKRWWPWGPTTSCSTPSAAMPSSWMFWPRW